MLKKEGSIAPQLVTYHNIAYMLNLMSTLRQSIIHGRFPEFVREFMLDMFPAKDYPDWAVAALIDAGITL